MDHEAVKQKEQIQKANQRKRNQEMDHEAVKQKEQIQKANQRERKRNADLEAFMKSENEMRSKSRKVETQTDRLREFRDATMLSAVFICISCQCKTFKSNVQEFTDKIMREVAVKIPLEDCIADLQVKTKIIIMGDKSSSEEEGKRYICITCLKKLKVSKLPSTSVMNNLQLHDTDEKLRQDDLILTELEGSLIARNLIFQKIFLLPRTPNEAGLIGLELKRKIELKNNHKKQLVNPTKIFKWLKRLKESGNPKPIL